MASLSALADTLRQTLGILHKQDIQTAAAKLGTQHQGTRILLGDDCAAIPDGEGYLLLAAEGLLPALVEAEPWFAGWCAILVNVSDIYAMGGRPIAVVDAVWSRSREASQPLWDGMHAASQVFNVPIVGGHSNSHSPYMALSAAMLGRATQLISSFTAQPGDVLLLVSNMYGKLHPRFPCWDAATEADPVLLRSHLELLPQLAETGLCDAGKDISMGGIVGTLLMLLETSGCGAVLEVDRIPYPGGITLLQWLVCFPSYGFLLSVRPDQVEAVRSPFLNHDLVCEPIGRIQTDRILYLAAGGESLEFWNIGCDPLTGFGPPPQLAPHA